MTKLISAAFLKQETDLDTNIENRDLDNPIKRAQDRLRFLIGRQFYDELLTQVTVPSTITAANSALFDPYVKQFLAWKAYEFYTIASTAIRKRTGLRQFKDEVDDAAPESIVNLHIKDAKEQSQFYQGEMVNFILQEQSADSTAYPLYEADCENRKFGSGFGISGVSKLSTSQYDIAKKVTNNGD